MTVKRKLKIKTTRALAHKAAKPTNPKEPAIPEYKIIVVGDSAVGKTAIIHQFMTSSFSSDHTITTGVKN